jgi:hypothetical protein
MEPPPATLTDARRIGNHPGELARIVVGALRIARSPFRSILSIVKVAHLGNKIGGLVLQGKAAECFNNLHRPEKDKAKGPLTYLVAESASRLHFLGVELASEVGLCWVGECRGFQFDRGRRRAGDERTISARNPVAS